jgi:nicotinamide phosphoribosyltransferase
VNTPAILLTDGYKVDHRRQYPEGTTFVYSNLTPRGSRIEGVDEIVFFGLRYFMQKYLVDEFNEWFDTPCDVAVAEYREFLDSYLGPNNIGVDHIEALHKLQRLPIAIMALDEGTRVPMRVPVLTVENTDPEFFWLTNYIETLLSSVLWLPSTSATTADRYRKLFDRSAAATGVAPEFVQWQGHDFSFRGMSSPESAAISGAGHLLSFTGTDTIPAIKLLEHYYDGQGLIGGSVAATEHSVMCAGSKMDERETFNRLLHLYPSGIVSVVSDTWDLWNVINNILPDLKEEIEARDGKLVIRPDSGDPVKIICGDPDAPADSDESKGVVRLLDKVFGSTTNTQGYRVLNPKVGVIYGDAITFDRAQEILARLQSAGYAPEVVLGIGSYTYQYVTRDTFGWAMKATAAEINGKIHFLAKDPVTDDGLKKSATGFLTVTRENGKLVLNDGLSPEEQESSTRDLLRPAFVDSLISMDYAEDNTLDKIRERLRG